MGHELRITPLNASFGATLTDVVDWDQDDYTKRPTAAIYCKDPDVSWFQMKSTDTSPCLEPVIYGVRGGDRVAVKFEALLLKGQGSIAVDVFQVTPAYERVLSVTNELPANALDTYFRDVSMPCLLKLDPQNIGIVLRIRPTGTHNEMILRNLMVEIESANGSFDPQTQIVRYQQTGDYLDCIRTYSFTDADEAYNSLYPLFSEGHIEFPDDVTVSFGGDGDGFRGLMAMLPGSRYRAPLAIYFEYQMKDATTNLSVNVRGVDSYNQVVVGRSHDVPATGEWRKAAVYLDGTGFEGVRKLVADIGVHQPCQLQLRNVRFVSARFDDAVKRSPNRLEDLFTDLGVRLRGK